jgi:ribosomal protein L7/L12
LVTFRKDGFDLKDDSQRVFLENNLVAASDNGKSLLAGVKRVKEITDWGLKDSRDYVVAFFERKDKYNKATTSTTKEEAERRLAKYMKTNNSNKLTYVRFVMDITGWSLLESKNFFEDYKLKEAKRILKRGL